MLSGKASNAELKHADILSPKWKEELVSTFFQRLNEKKGIK